MNDPVLRVIDILCLIRNEIADVLCAVRDAALMRERAEAAIYVYAEGHPKAGQQVPWFDAADAYSFDETDGPHIIGMSPAVALAVADWLVSVADDPNVDFELINSEGYSALAVARAYLGET